MKDCCKTPLGLMRPSQQNARSFHLSQMMRLLCAFVFASLVSACAGGSGSSGFDISPSAENESINQVLTTKQCVPGEALTLCPANETALDVPVPGATPAPNGVDVGTQVDATDITRCGAGVDEICRISVLVNVAGLAPGSAYQVAARGVDPLTPWVIAGEAIVIASESPTQFPAAIEAPSSSLSVQVAVLVFVDGTGTTPGVIRTLTETGASLAFVASPMLLPR